MTTRTSATESAARALSTMPGTRSRCFAEPKREDAPAASTIVPTIALIVHSRGTNTWAFPRYARRGEEAGCALDDASTSKEKSQSALAADSGNCPRDQCTGDVHLVGRAG